MVDGNKPGVHERVKVEEPDGLTQTMEEQLGCSERRISVNKIKNYTK